MKKEKKLQEVEGIKNEKEFFEALKKAKKGGLIIFDEGEDETKNKKKKDKNKVTINISKEVQMNLDSLRREIVEIVSNTNDLDLMKKVEKCSYDKLILLLNVGFSEKSFYDTLNGKTEMKVEDIILTDKSKEVLKQLLEEKKEEKKDEVIGDKNAKND
jgi:hypothetical protein